MNRLREFKDYWPEQILEVAQMLYALKPFDVHTSNKTHWNLLVQQAFEFLDKLNEAREEIAERRKKQGERYAILNGRLTEADKLPAIVPLEKAARWITCETHTARALPKLKKILSVQAQRSGYDKAWIERTLDERLICWRKKGLPRDEGSGVAWRLRAPLVADRCRTKQRQKDEKVI